MGGNMSPEIKGEAISIERFQGCSVGLSGPT